jgi:hypothetical protein
MEVIPLSGDAVFNFFFSFGIYWTFILGGFFAVLALFRL